MKYIYVRMFTNKAAAKAAQKKLKKQGYKTRIISYNVKGGKQYVLYRSRG